MNGYVHEKTSIYAAEVLGDWIRLHIDFLLIMLNSRACAAAVSICIHSDKACRSPKHLNVDPRDVSPPRGAVQTIHPGVGPGLATKVWKLSWAPCEQGDPFL